MVEKIKCIVPQSELDFWGLWLTSGIGYDVVRVAVDGTSVWVVNDAGQPEFIEEGGYSIGEATNEMVGSGCRL
ncbi:hypothetical protein PHB09_173 [Pseudomonas phage PHB09]|uniref:Uncharacterized protein n=1 Tax=Pseudomonas phage PHB09 TaxID=2867265 RepID=A0AAE9BNE8_9CAUD|nr:hypothetical protein QGX10_gp172 [Pseudomonas phage PHB09]UAV84668.1 hypothetical protein PHB09_173 [Pseudomonas phage PHB09]